MTGNNTPEHSQRWLWKGNPKPHTAELPLHQGKATRWCHLLWAASTSPNLHGECLVTAAWICTSDTKTPPSCTHCLTQKVKQWKFCCVGLKLHVIRLFLAYNMKIHTAKVTWDIIQHISWESNILHRCFSNYHLFLSMDKSSQTVRYWNPLCGTFFLI